MFKVKIWLAALFFIVLLVVFNLEIEIASAQGASMGRWDILESMPTARTEVAVAALGGKLYVVGGFGGRGETLATVEIYDPSARSWSQGKPLPAPLHHVGAVAAGGAIYVIGGFKEGWVPQASNWRFDPVANIWEPRAAMITARGALALAELNGVIYAVGGLSSAGDESANEAYDPEAFPYADFAPRPRSSFGGINCLRYRGRTFARLVCERGQ